MTQQSKFQILLGSLRKTIQLTEILPRKETLVN